MNEPRKLTAGNDAPGNLFLEPRRLERRALLRLGLAGCAAAGAVCLLRRGGPGLALAQDAMAESGGGAGRAAAGGAGASPAAAPLGPKLAGVVRQPAMFWEQGEERRIQCKLCPRECQVADVERGYCGVRENQGGQYQTLVYGALCAANVDPIEKKPLFHYLPGTEAFSIATAGCNIECKFCQNWQISQFRPEQVESVRVTPERLVETARARGCPTIAYTYSEPVIFYEYMHDSAALARAQGVGAVMISNGYIQEKPLRQLCQQLTAVKIDFKAFSDGFYTDTCAGHLKPVLAALETLHAIGIWFEIVVLVIPTLNDAPQEIEGMSRWVVEHLGPDVPVHFTRFHPTYRITNLPRTPIKTLERCRQIALAAGVHYVYAGNVPMHPGENTYCHGCGKELIRRLGFKIVKHTIGAGGRCPHCDTRIPGVWSQEAALAFKPRG